MLLGPFFGRRKFIVNLGWMTVNLILTAGTAALINLLVARRLGPSRFGQWSLIVAGVSWVIGIRGAINSDLIRKCAQRRDAAPTLLVPAWLLTATVGGGLGIIGSLTTISLQSGANRVATCIMLVATLISAMLAVISAVFMSRDQMYWGLCDGVQGLIVVITISILPVAASSISSLAAVYLVAAILCAVPISVYAALTFRPTLRLNVIQTVRDLAVDNGWLAGVNLCVIGHLSVDLYVLEAYRGSLEVGVYNCALRVVVLARLIPWLVMMSALPDIARRLAASDTAFIRRLWRRVTDWVLPVQGLAVLALIATSTFIVSVLYSSQYRAAAAVLSVLAVSLLPHCLSQALSAIVMSSGRYRQHFCLSALTLLAHILFSLLLIPRFGPAGASVAFAFGETLGAISLGVLGWRIFGPFRLRGIGAMLGCLGAAICCWGYTKRLNLTLLQSNSAVLLIYTSLSVLCLWASRKPGRAVVRLGA
jgi:O-antigen/teichoic acid export membrane protein